MSTSVLEQHLYSAAVGSDEAFWHALNALLTRTESHSRRDVLKAFEDLSGFYTDSPCLPLRKLAKRVFRSCSGEAFAAYMLHRHNGDLGGVELSNRQGTLFAVLLPDASAPGNVRASFFDRRGFSGHISRSDYPTLMLELAGDGYCLEAPGALTNAFLADAFDKRYDYQAQTAKCP